MDIEGGGKKFVEKFVFFSSRMPICFDLKIGELAINAFSPLKLAIADNDNKHDGVEDEQPSDDSDRKEDVYERTKRNINRLTGLALHS